MIVLTVRANDANAKVISPSSSSENAAASPHLIALLFVVGLALRDMLRHAAVGLGVEDATNILSVRLERTLHTLWLVEPRIIRGPLRKVALKQMIIATVSRRSSVAAREGDKTETRRRVSGHRRLKLAHARLLHVDKLADASLLVGSISLDLSQVDIVLLVAIYESRILQLD